MTKSELQRQVNPEQWLLGGLRSSSQPRFAVMGDGSRCVALVSGPCLTLVPADGCAGGARAIVSTCGAAAAEPGR